MNTVKQVSVLLALIQLVCTSCMLSPAGPSNQLDATSGQPGIKEMPLTLTVDLADGSRLIGVPNIISIPVQTAYAKLDIALKQVRSITLEKDRELAVFEMTNGDRVKGAMILKTMDLQTAFGKVSVGLDQIRKFDVVSSGSLKTALPKGMILYYSFDKDESGCVADLSGKGNNGMLHGTEWVSQGKIGGARAFNGRGDYISIDYDGKTGLFPTEAPLSVAVWFKTSASVPVQQMVIATHYAGEGRDGYLLEINTRFSDGRAVWTVAIPGTEEARSQPAINDGQWHHAAGVWDGRQKLLYIDGTLQGTAQASGSLVYTHRAPFQIGHIANNNAPYSKDEFYYFKGSLDEVMVFNRALTAEDVQALFNKTLRPTRPSGNNQRFMDIRLGCISSQRQEDLL